MRSKKSLILIIVVALIILAGVALLLRRRADQTVTARIANAKDGSFFVQVERPILSGRPIWDVPRALFGDRDSELRFGDQSPGAKFGDARFNHVELKADGWELVIESNGQGEISTGTHLVFTLPLPGRNLRLDCRPSEPADGHFLTTLQTGSDKIDGGFIVLLTRCKNADSGKNTAGLPSFTLRGGFKGLPQSPRS